MTAPSELQLSFWMDKAVKWGQATTPSAQQDMSKHLGSLRSFLQQLLHTLQLTSSATEAVKSLPFVGQFLGRLCWNPYVTADGESCSLLLQCVCCLYSAEPRNALEQRANDWIRNLLCHLTSAEEGGVIYALERFAGIAPHHCSSQALQKMVALLTEEVSVSCSPAVHSLDRCLCDSIHAVSVACVPLITCPEAAPLIGALLKRRISCGCSHLSEEFIEAVSTALLSKTLVLEDMAVIALWCHSLSSLEGAVLSLLESVLSDPGAVLQRLEEVVSSSFLPKASAQHCCIFLIVNDVFRNVLMAMEENVAVGALIQVFTSCFLRSHSAQKQQERLPLRAFFPHVPQNLLTPLLTEPSEVPRQAWLEHVSWIGRLLHSMSREADQVEEKGDSPRQRRALFEAWFLLAQRGHWVDVAAELLVSVDAEQSEPLLCLLTFYHHPTDRGHQSSQQIMAAREAWGRMRILFLAHTLPPERLSSMNKLLSSATSANLLLRLLLSFAIFCPAFTSTAVKVLQKVLTQAELKRRAEWLLASAWHRLSRGGALDAALQDRLRALQDSLLPEHISRCT
ncbi:Fanconi anemia group C protein isoform X2 [Electrophorus electricus]|nr:Fanconi anemia group C protein isoform X2 [Electrophorus electricus]XP_026887563.2 Fanconi anemia group C protein isoform X2 [Electrophorus electricus]